MFVDFFLEEGVKISKCYVFVIVWVNDQQVLEEQSLFNGHFLGCTARVSIKMDEKMQMGNYSSRDLKQSFLFLL